MSTVKPLALMSASTSFGISPGAAEGLYNRRPDRAEGKLAKFVK
jgi:hypothetical protein